MPRLGRPVVLIGGGGHARVLLSTLLLLQARILGYVALVNPEEGLLGIPCIGDDQAVLAHDPAEVLLVNGIGSAASIGRRSNAYEFFRSRGYEFTSVIHPSAIVASNVELAAGVQIMAGAILQSGVVARENCIINTGAIVDHDCVLESHAHVAPGAVLCGGVHVRARAHVGAGATVIQGVSIGAGAIIGAGAVVTSNVAESCTVVGTPARPVQREA